MNASTRKKEKHTNVYAGKHKQQFQQNYWQNKE